jgi:hypothetical protein
MVLQPLLTQDVLDEPKPQEQDTLISQTPLQPTLSFLANSMTKRKPTSLEQTQALRNTQRQMSERGAMRRETLTLKEPLT